MKRNKFGQAEPLTKDQFRQVLSQLQSESHRLIFALCWYTCERPITILRIRVDDVYQDPARSLPRKKLVIPANTRKDARTREVPIAESLKWELKAYSPPSTGYLFPGAQPGSHLCFSAYDKALRRAFDRLGWRGFSTYSTRRGSLTELSRAGLSIRQIQAVSGHASLSSLQRYLEVSPAEVERAIALL
jgi:integrase/recombinase XerD